MHIHHICGVMILRFLSIQVVYKNVISLETELEWIRRVIQNENEYRCAIFVDGEYVGNIYLTDITEFTANYHIFIGNKNFWGKGVEKELQS